MKLLKRCLSILLTTVMAVSLFACGSTSGTTATTDTAATDEAETTTTATDTGSESATSDAITTLLNEYQQNSQALTINSSAWNYDADNDVYWQIGIGYCADPATTDYETLGIYVPGAYMTGVDNGDGTFTCTINATGEVAGFTAETAPIVFPVNTAGYSAQAAPTTYSYDGLSSYLTAGYIYVFAGMRGRDNGYDDSNNLTYSGGAPWGVTDLKAAIRYYRFNESVLPGNTESIFTFGMSGGGAQSAVTGASGDSELYYDYLTSIGAAMYDTDGNYISDAVCGSMCWCPITSLDFADEAYEWNLGQYTTDGTRADTTWTSALSDDLATSYAAYINELGLTDESGNVLTLSESSDGIYTAGSYYDYLLTVINGSLNNFLTDTTFPYTASSGGFKADGGFGGGDATGTGTMPTDGSMQKGDLPSGEAPTDGGAATGTMPSDATSAGSSTSETAATYATAQDYIDSLNSDVEWVEYDATTNTAKITSMAAFITHCKNASKDVGAFDDLNTSQAENNLFGNDESDSLHFDTVMANLLSQNTTEYATFSDWDATIVQSYLDDITAVDSLGNNLTYRMNMYNPMYYVSDYYEGYGTSKVATYWRIRTGIDQGDTALTVETNLALALEQDSDVKSVDFETVWGQAHTTAERTGDSTTNFIEWVNECVNQ